MWTKTLVTAAHHRKTFKFQELRVTKNVPREQNIIYQLRVVDESFEEFHIA